MEESQEEKKDSYSDSDGEDSIPEAESYNQRDHSEPLLKYAINSDSLESNKESVDKNLSKSVVMTSHNSGQSGSKDIDIEVDFKDLSFFKVEKKKKNSNSMIDQSEESRKKSSGLNDSAR
jgi:hypothetical protein